MIGSLVDYSFVLRNFILIGKYHELFMYYDENIQFTIDGCGDYCQVWCVAFFSKTSILVVSFGLHQGIQLVDGISMYLAQLAFCSDCREVVQ